MGAVVRAYRKASGVSQKELAALVGISRATLNYLESGRDLEIGAGKLLALLEVLGVPIGLPDAVDREQDDRILAKAAKASGGRKTKLGRATVVEAMATGRAPTGSEAGLRALLDHADLATALAMVRVAATGTGQPAKAVWKRTRALAAAVGATSPVWSGGAAGTAGGPED